jgi:hypothetical protein
MDMHEESERIEMSRRERDRLKVLYGVVQGERSQKEAARLLRLTTRQVRRLVRRLEEQGDQGLIHRLRGRAAEARSHSPPVVVEEPHGPRDADPD